MPDIRSQAKDAILSLLETVTFHTPINGATTWRLTGRRLKHFAKVDSNQQPCLFLTQHRETYSARGVEMPVARILDLGCWCYAPTGDEDIEGDRLLDIMFDGIEQVIGEVDSPSRNALTLNGLVYGAYIDPRNGILFRDAGDLDGQALLVVPIRVLLP